MISVLDPEAMYIVKNTGTMVIGVSKDLEIETEDIKTLAQTNSAKGEKEDAKEDPHLFQIVASDTTVF